MILERIGEDPSKHVLAMKWLAYMMQHVDHQGLERVLEYYEKIGWIGTRAKEELSSIASGLKSTGRGEWTLPFRVHLTSLLFISKLADIPIERDLTGINTYIENWINSPEEILSI